MLEQSIIECGLFILKKVFDIHKNIIKYRRKTKKYTKKYRFYSTNFKACDIIDMYCFVLSGK